MSKKISLLLIIIFLIVFTLLIFDSRKNRVMSAIDGASWAMATFEALWQERSRHTSVVFNNKIWVMGGTSAWGNKNDVWYSTNGFSWTQLIDAAQWSARYGHTSVVFNPGTGNKIWVMGGWDGTAYKNDVWYSSTGLFWTQATGAAQWSARNSHSSVVFNNKIWVMGGTSASGNKNDVWYSSDGISWTQAPNAPWLARTGHTSVVFNPGTGNKIWVMGGWDGTAYKNDVWYSSDGISWTQAPNAPWRARTGHTSVVFDNKIWVMGGWPFYRDVWYTSDGVSWTQATDNAQWPPRFCNTLVVFNNKIWVMGGATPFERSDVWYSIYSVSGWAWSENIGWISFSCDNLELPATRCTNDYGVNLDITTGIFSGYAWSEHIGWISFNRADTGNPPGPPFDTGAGPIARLDLDGTICGQQRWVCGWARALSFGGGWDGWIKLRGIWNSGVATGTYGVRLDTSVIPNEFRDWAWVENVIGWVSFNCSNQGVCGASNYKVITTVSLNTPAYVESVDLDGTPVFCNIAPARGRIGLKWTYKDDDGDNMAQYHLQVATDFGFSNLMVDATSSLNVPPDTIVTSAVWPDYNNPPGTDDLYIDYRGPGNPYYWRVRVKAATGNQNWSDWIEGLSFDTPSHAYPWPDFALRPPIAPLGMVMTFVQDGTDPPPPGTKALCYSGGVGHLCQTDPNTSYFWDFGNGSTSPYKGNATTTYVSTGNYSALFKITDNTLPAPNNYCSIPKTIRVAPPLPKWKEVPPY